MSSSFLARDDLVSSRFLTPSTISLTSSLLSLAGTMCKDGAITWDTTSEASPEDSSSASASIAEFVSTKAQAVSSSLASVEAVATDAAVHVKLNAVKTPSFTTPGPSSTSSPSSSEDDEDDWECDTDVAEEVTPSSSSSSTYTTSAAPRKTQVQLNAQKPKTTTQAPTTTTAPVVQVSASVSVGGGTSDWLTGGKATVSFSDLFSSLFPLADFDVYLYAVLLSRRGLWSLR